MVAKPKLKTFQYGDPIRGKSLRIGTTRRPPRGVPKKFWKLDGYFDVWFPVLAPSLALLRRFQGKLEEADAYQNFCASYERELLQRAESRQAIELIAAVCLRTPVSIGCYCENESRCHRKHLAKLILRAARGSSRS
jgi:uncharacterized protein YeaO (DUF488 family)